MAEHLAGMYQVTDVRADFIRGVVGADAGADFPRQAPDERQGFSGRGVVVAEDFAFAVDERHVVALVALQHLGVVRGADDVHQNLADVVQ